MARESLPLLICDNYTKFRLSVAILRHTAEHNPFTEEALDAMRALARKGLARIFKLMPKR